MGANFIEIPVKRVDVITKSTGPRSSHELS